MKERNQLMAIFLRSARSIGSFTVLALTLIVTVTPLLAQAPPPMETTLKQMLEAIETKSYDQFMAQADSAFKTFFTQAMFESLSRQLGPRLQQGHSSNYFGQLNQDGYLVHVWKLSLKDGQDYLLTIFFKGGKVSGFVTR